jgi:hypothetical protein
MRSTLAKLRVGEGEAHHDDLRPVRLAGVLPYDHNIIMIDSYIRYDRKTLLPPIL